MEVGRIITSNTCMRRGSSGEAHYPQTVDSSAVDGKSPGAGGMARACVGGFARRMRVCETRGTCSDSFLGAKVFAWCYRAATVEDELLGDSSSC